MTKCADCQKNDAWYWDEDGQAVCSICPIKHGYESVRMTDPAIEGLNLDDVVEILKIRKLRRSLGTSEQRRSARQELVHEWCKAAFGVEHATNPKQRVVRLLEEVVEAYQAAGADPAMAHKLIDFVFARPVGDIAQELGGVGVTLLALAEAVGVDADECERLEVDRVLAKPLAHFAERNAAKDAAGFNVAAMRPELDDGA